MTAHVYTTVAKSALLGLERAQPDLPSVDGALGTALAAIPTTETETRWLDAAAITSLHAEVGRLPAKGASDLQPCPADTRPVCNRAARNYLATMLSGRFEFVLPEFLQALDHAGRRAPEIQVPALLDAALKSPAHAELFTRVCGEVGPWIGGRSTNWSKLFAGESSAAWTDGTLPERVDWLASLRKVDAAAGREALAAVWDSEAPKEKAALLAALEYGLCQDDEPFLESALDDKRKEVRTAAAELLVKLPGCALGIRMRQRLSELLQIDKKGRVEVTLPRALDKSMERDGIEKLSPVHIIGSKAWWFTQMLSCVPPSEWCTGKLKPADLLKSLGHNEWSLALLHGWTKAAVTHKDQSWCLALLNTNLDKLDWTLKSRILPALDHETRMTVLPKLPGEFRLAAFSASHHVPEPWDKAFTLEVARDMRNELKKLKPGRHETEEGLRASALMDISVADKVEKLLDTSQLPEEAQSFAQEMLDLLRFRREALNAIKEKP